MPARKSITRIALFVMVLFTIVRVPAQETQPASSTQAPLTLTLQDALNRARANSVQFQAALTDQGIAHEDKVQARAGLLPSVNYNNEFIYTQPNGTPSGVFIANNTVHEYLSQGDIHQVIGYTNYADYRRARALEAVARAKAEVAKRGLVVAVVQGYYGLIAAQRKYANVQQAASEAQQFLALSQKLENGGEVAHADVIKAQIQYNDRQRDLREAQLAMDKSRLDLAVILFPDFNLNFTVVDDAQLAPPLVSFDEFVKEAQNRNPDVRASSASFQAAKFEVASAQSAYLPTLTLDYFYGIDAASLRRARARWNTQPWLFRSRYVEYPYMELGRDAQQSCASQPEAQAGPARTYHGPAQTPGGYAGAICGSRGCTRRTRLAEELSRSGRGKPAADHSALSGR